MAINPLKLLKMKDRLTTFREEHPKVFPFFHAMKETGIQPGSIIELKIIDTDGKEHVTNIRVTDNDVETLSILGQMDKENEKDKVD